MKLTDVLFIFVIILLVVLIAYCVTHVKEMTMNPCDMCEEKMPQVQCVHIVEGQVSNPEAMRTLDLNEKQNITDS